MNETALSEEANELARCIDRARAAVQSNEWDSATRLLAEVQDRIGRLLREVGDKGREVMQAPTPDRGDCE